MKRLRLIFVVLLLVLTTGACTWQQTLAWDDAHGWSRGTTNHLLVEIYGDEANTHPDAVAARQAQSPEAGIPPAPYYPWDNLAECESHGEWDYGPHSDWGSHMYEGGLQFAPGTWDSYKYAGYPDAAYQATREQQIAVGIKLQKAAGWGQWPHCSAELGLR